MAADTTSNVVEVDFASRALARLPLGDLVASVTESLGSISTEIADIRRVQAWESAQYRFERSRCRRLERELLEERRRSFSFTDDAILAALRRAYRGEPVAAVAVARELVAEPTHSMRIRAGLILAKLAADGRAVKLPPTREGHSAHQWQPSGGDDAS